MNYKDWLSRTNERLPKKLRYEESDLTAYAIYLQTQPDINSSSKTEDYPETFIISVDGDSWRQYSKVSIHPHLRCCLYRTFIHHATTPAYKYFTSYDIERLKVQ